MKKQNFLKGSIILMISVVLAKALGALFKIPLTNMLGGVGMSYFSCAYSLFMPVYALTVTGLSAAVARMTAQSAALGMFENARRIRRTALVIFSAAGLAGSLITLLLARPFSIFSAGTDQAALAVAMISPSVLLGCITAVERGYYEGLSNMYPTALSQAAEGAVKVAAGLWLCGYAMGNSKRLMELFPFVTDVRALAAAAGILGVTLSSLGAVLFFAVLRLFRGKAPAGESCVVSHRSIAAELVKTALPVGVSSVVTNLTALIDMWTIIGCMTFFGVGTAPPAGVSEADMPRFVYGSFAGIALTVFNLVPSVTNMLGKGVLPGITEAWANHDRAALRSGTQQALLTCTVMAVPAAFGLGVLSEQVLLVLFPRQTDEVALCVGALRLLMPGMVCLCLSFPLFSMLQAIGRPSAPMKIMLMGAAIKLAGNLLLIPVMGAGGANGAAASTTLSYGVILAVSLAVYFHESGISVSLRPFIAVLYSGVMCGGGAWLAADVTVRSGGGAVLTVLISAAAGGGVYLLCILLSLGRGKLIRPAVSR